MKEANIHYKKLVLVCTKNRDDGKDCCKNKGSEDLYMKIKLAVAEKDPSIRVSKTSCLGNCLSGAVVVIMPDDIWLGDVQEADIPEIVKMIQA